MISVAVLAVALGPVAGQLDEFIRAPDDPWDVHTVLRGSMYAVVRGDIHDENGVTILEVAQVRRGTGVSAGARFEVANDKAADQQGDTWAVVDAGRTPVQVLLALPARTGCGQLFASYLDYLAERSAREQTSDALVEALADALRGRDGCAHRLAFGVIDSRAPEMWRSCRTNSACRRKFEYLYGPIPYFTRSDDGTSFRRSSLLAILLERHPSAFEAITSPGFARSSHRLRAFVILAKQAPPRVTAEELGSVLNELVASAAHRGDSRRAPGAPTATLAASVVSTVVAELGEPNGQRVLNYLETQGTGSAPYVASVARGMRAGADQ